MSKGAYARSTLRRKYSSFSSIASFNIEMFTQKVALLSTLKNSWKKFSKSMPPVK